ncbi:MAG: hypothetical protein EOM23_08120, partial [Candidatus Moranbacteria bacterium]|nr:hypothetical protein [Candidatus Moranbacteria bacterium]
MEKRELKIGDVVQIAPEHDDKFGGCFMVVSKVYEFGAQGDFPTPGKNGLVYYWCPFSAMELIGHAEWINDQEKIIIRLTEENKTLCEKISLLTKKLEEKQQDCGYYIT